MDGTPGAALTLDQLDPARAHTTWTRQDSGCFSYGIDVGDDRWFVKRSTSAAGERSLERCVEFHRAVEHAAIVAPRRVFRAPTLVIVYPWTDGEVLNAATSAGSDRRSLLRFRSIPPATRSAAITTVLDSHREVAARGFVAVDFYDGCLLYDFDRERMHLIDLDEYRPGPFVVQQDRLPGSRSYMAPEEFERGAAIDERTMVFRLGRMIVHLLHNSATAERAELARLASLPDPDQRVQTVEALWRAWVDLSPG